MTAIGQATPDGRTATDLVSVDRAIAAAVTTGVAALIVIGFLTSYETLRNLAATDGGFPLWLAPAVPLSFDLGIAVLSLKIVAAARQGRRAVLLRLLVACLSVSSVAVNSTASTGTAGRLLHAVPPAMFVVCFESLVASARRAATAGRRRPRPAIWPWLLAPWPTFTSWRARVLITDRAASSAASGPARPGTARTSGRQRPSARPVEQPRPTPPAAVSSRAPASAGDTDRAACARRAFAERPGLTAPALADHLRTHGHPVSVRTAQRIRASIAAEAGRPGQGVLSRSA